MSFQHLNELVLSLIWFVDLLSLISDKLHQAFIPTNIQLNQLTLKILLSRQRVLIKAIDLLLDFYGWYFMRYTPWSAGYFTVLM